MKCDEGRERRACVTRSNIKSKFTKYDSLAIKGIAILMMLMHHNFWKKELFEKYTIDFRPFTESFIVDLALSFKICVSLFVFITGYGLTLSLKRQQEAMGCKEQSKWIINRLISVLSGYWFIAILAYTVCEILSKRTTEIFFNNGILEGCAKLMINFMGLSNLFDISTYNGTWWYMSAAVVFVCLVPIFYKIAKQHGYLSLIFLGVGLPRILQIGYPGGTALLSFILPLILGMTFAEYDLLARLKEAKVYKQGDGINKGIKFVLATIMLVSMFKLYIALPNEKFWDIKWGIIPVFVIYYCYEFIIDLPILRSVLIYLGRHSMNIFLVHTFIRYYYLSDLNYGFEHFLLINVFLLASSLVLSHAIEGLKSVLRYEKWMSRLTQFANRQIDRVYSVEL